MTELDTELMTRVDTELKKPFSKKKFDIAKEFFLEEGALKGISKKELPYFVREIKTNYPTDKN